MKIINNWNSYDSIDYAIKNYKKDNSIVSIAILEKEQLYEAQPEWVKKNPGGIDYAEERAFTTRKGPEITKHPGVKYKELEKGFIPEKYLTGHELFNWFMDAR